jgi:uncharacterized membrane protein
MTPQRSGFDWIGEAICLAGLAAAFGEVIANWSDLPARVPRHFGISGLPDGWGAKTGLWLAPAIAAGLGKAFLPISPITLLGIPAWYLLRLRSLRVMP